MFSKYLLIALALSIAALSTMTWLYLGKRDELAVAKVAMERQITETQKAIQEIENIKAQHALQLQLSAAHLKEKQRDNTQLRKESANVRNSLSTLEEALIREPERAGRVSSYLFARGLRDISKHSGSTQADRKIAVPKPAKARPRGPAEGGVGADQGVGEEEGASRKPAVHPASRLREPAGVQ